MQIWRKWTNGPDLDFRFIVKETRQLFEEAWKVGSVFGRLLHEEYGEALNKVVVVL